MVLLTLSMALLCTGCSSNNKDTEPDTPDTPVTPTDPTDPVTPVVEDTTLYDCDALCTPNPSAEALKVYNYFRRIYGRKIISGAMAAVNWNTYEAQWVNYHTQHYPVLTCFDYIQLTVTDDWAKNTYSSYEIYEDWWNNGGLVAGMWHHIVPMTEATETVSNSATYEPAKTTFKAANALIEGTWENKIYTQDLAKVAEHLKGFRDRHIPVIWRPYHEAAGKWFWWGAEGSEVEKALWKYMWNYFVNDCGLNNLIWVWTTQGSDMNWYPGDEYVDIVGRDIYNKSEASSAYNYFAYDISVFPNKMLALSECGSVATIGVQWAADAKWLFFMPWYDNKITGNGPNSIKFKDANQVHTHATLDWWNAAWSQPYVLDRATMPSLK